MDPCPESPFRDLSPFADLLWLRTNELTLLPDELTCFFDSGAAKTFLEQPAHRRYIVQASRAPDRVTVDTDKKSDAPLAMALFSLHSTSSDPRIRHGSVVCILRGFTVTDEWQGRGLGRELFGKVHAYAFELAQLLAIAERANGYNLPEAPVLDFRLHEGCCFREPRALLVYQRNGASVTVGARAVSEEQLRSWAKLKQPQFDDQATPHLGNTATATLPRQQVAYAAMTVEVHFPALDLSAPYLAPTATPSKCEVQNAFVGMETTGAVPPEVFLRRPSLAKGTDEGPVSLVKYNSQLRLGSLSIGGVRVDPLIGCYKFSVPALPCALLEQYLRDRKNTVLPPRGWPSLVLKRDGDGVPTKVIAGYNAYAATCADFDPKSQAARTRVASVLDLKEALLDLPGCRALLAMAAPKLKLAYEYLIRPHQVHILVQDFDLQAGFGWHTDGEGTRISRERERNVVSLAIQLSCSAVSAMWVHGFQPCVYEGRGACVLFHGGSLHRSMPWAPHVFQKNPTCSVIKIVFFYADVPC